MAGTLAAIDDAELVAVGSRAQETADRFAAEHGVTRAFASYEALCADPDVDIVYVATTTDQHHSNTLMAIEAGKAVLCEKPIGLNSGQAVEMFTAATEAGLFCMEAMWMRFNPFLAKIDQLISAGEIGELRTIEADFGFAGTPGTHQRHFLNALGGGALLDLGIYPLTLAYHLAGLPSESLAIGRISSESIDESIAVVSRHESEVISTLSASIVSDTPVRATIGGSEGRIELARMFHFSPSMQLWRRDEHVKTFDVGFEGHGFQFEVAEVHRCLRAGLTQSDAQSHVKSLDVVGWSDDLRHQIGATFTVERT